MINLTLELEEVNGILTALGQLPYVQVQPLIGKIQQQATVQIAPIENQSKSE